MSGSIIATFLVRFSYNPYFSACFSSQNNVFLSQQISQNSVSACFFSEVNGAKMAPLHPASGTVAAGSALCTEQLCQP